MKEGTFLSEKKMADGRTLRVLRFVSPEDEVPERVVRYVIGSLGFDSYNEYIQTQAYWRSWYRESSIIDTFVEGNAEAFAGKTIVPFATSGGSGMGDSTANLQALAPAARVLEGRRFRGSVSAEELKAWADSF